MKDLGWGEIPEGGGGEILHRIDIIAQPAESRRSFMPAECRRSSSHGFGYHCYREKNLDKYIESTEQLVTEIVVKDIKRSTSFYRLLGFQLLRDGGDFVELTWEDHRLFLAEISAFHDVDPGNLERPVFPVANVRIMVPNVDHYWNLASEIKAEVILAIGDRYYGLRDFTIADPDGFGIRF